MGKASARQVEDLGSNPSECQIFSIAPLRSFFSATLAKRWKVQFRQGFVQFNNVDSKTTSNNNIAIYMQYMSYIQYIYTVYLIDIQDVDLQSHKLMAWLLKTVTYE